MRGELGPCRMTCSFIHATTTFHGKKAIWIWITIDKSFLIREAGRGTEWHDRPEIDTARPISIPSNLLRFPLSSLSDKINKKNKQESVRNYRERGWGGEIIQQNHLRCWLRRVICGSAALSRSSCVPKSGHFGAFTESTPTKKRKE